MAPRVAIITSQRMLCETLAVLLPSAGLVVTAIATDAKRLAFVAGQNPDVAIVDVSTHETATLTRLAGLCPSCRLLALFATAEERLIVDCLRANAHSVVSSEGPLGVLANAIAKTARGERVISPEALEVLAGPVADAKLARGRTQKLTQRERQVVRLAMAGMPARDVARSLGIQPATVSVHMANVLTKLRLPTKAKLSCYIHTHAPHLLPGSKA